MAFSWPTLPPCAIPAASSASPQARSGPPLISLLSLPAYQRRSPAPRYCRRNYSPVIPPSQAPGAAGPVIPFNSSPQHPELLPGVNEQRSCLFTPHPGDCVLRLGLKTPPAPRGGNATLPLSLLRFGKGSEALPEERGALSWREGPEGGERQGRDQSRQEQPRERDLGDWGERAGPDPEPETPRGQPGRWDHAPVLR